MSFIGCEVLEVLEINDDRLGFHEDVEKCMEADDVCYEEGSPGEINPINPSDPLPATLGPEVVGGGETGESGETGAALPSDRAEVDAHSGMPSVPIDVSNADFVAAVYRVIPHGAQAVICSKAGDPAIGGWVPRSSADVDRLCVASHNNYFNCSSFNPDASGEIHARKANFAACHALMLDDIGTKVPFDIFAVFELSWLIETSPGNYQGGILLDPPLQDPQEASSLLDAMARSGMCDPGSKGPDSRWARLPVGINGKVKNLDKDGRPFQCRLVEWRPERKYTVAEIVSSLHLVLEPTKKVTTAQTGTKSISPSLRQADDVYTPKPLQNPVLTALKHQGLYKRPLGADKHDITCPWVSEHTDALDSGSAYFEPSHAYPDGGFCCQHSHGGNYHVGELLEHLQLSRLEARHKPVIRIVHGELARVVDAAEHALADQGKHYNAGGVIVSIETDSISGRMSILPTNQQELTRELSVAISWQQYSRSKLVACDPPLRPVSMLYDAQKYPHLPRLVGLAHQPYFRESDGELICKPGYDSESCRFGAFDPVDFPIPAPTHEVAKLALESLEELLAGFHFAAAWDKSAALAAIFTAVVRPSVALAPGFHVQASMFGSGKSYLCDLIGAFAGPGFNLKVSYPATAEEATKTMLSLLLTQPPVVEFDDMNTDWLPHGTINRMFTGPEITDRVLGVSKTATVSTRTLFLGSGNNVGPIKDLRRRVLTIKIDARCETPATLVYSSDPLTMVRKNRGRYVAAVLTIILAWRATGAPKTAPGFASFGGDWSDLARHPLVWLGQIDPATSLFDQIKHDPDAEALEQLMAEWQKVFGSSFTTVRKAVDSAEIYSDLKDAICEFPVVMGKDVNPGKLGWLINKNANRIVKGMCFQRGRADGRLAWAVVSVLTRTEENSPDPLDPPEADLPSQLEHFDKF